MLALALAVIAPPLDAAAWEVLRYGGIRPNAVTFDGDGMRIHVDRSAAPIVHALPSPRRVSGLRAAGRIDGTLHTTAERQGQRGEDDYTLRLGLVEVGTRRPSWLERLFAPGWVKELFALAPPDLGIDGIRFFNLGLAASQIGESRRHPASDLISEQVVGIPADDGTFTLAIDFDAPIDTAAIWIGCDGDDTGSRFVVTLTRLELLTADRGDAATPGATGRP